MLEEYEIKDKQVFFKTLCVGTTLWIGCIIYYAIYD